MILFSLLSFSAIALAAVDEIKQVILYNNGESRDGVEHEVHAADFGDGLAAWYETLNVVQPVKKAHTVPGTATVASVFNGNGVNITSVR